MNDYQNLFNRDFYPTPLEVIDTMTGMTDIAGKVCLEPSFGSGNIVRFLVERGAKEVLGCEINDTLRRSITDCTVIGTDFLQVQSDDICHVQLIVMNPPFSKQEDHILHAWNIAPSGCEIITLCNASMLVEHRANQKQKEIISIIGDNGYSEILGDVFSEKAERRTGCEIAMIRIVKPGTNEMEFDGYFTDEPDEPEMQGNGIIPYNVVREAVQRYIAAVSRFDSAMAANNEINNITKEFGFGSIKFGAFKHNDTYEPVTKQQFKKELQKRAWRWIFDKFNMERYVTSSVLETVNKAVEMQSNMPFTMRNVYRMIEMIVGTHADRMQQVVLDAFDIICKYSEDNVTYVGEKWKTNSAHMVNKKFIVPYCCRYDSRWPSATVDISYGSNVNKMDDVVKALCFLTGEPYEREERDENGNVRTIRKRSLQYYVSNRRMNWGQWYDWTFFYIKGFKKGTMHFEFQDEEVWYKFNQAVAKVRGWELPSNVKVKKGAKK